jgi:LmbE family N-acetylglucosaminyl deacetylase
LKILYIFPHPDDESFGPAHAICKQLREGHEVYLLTLTKGGATRQRFKYNYSVEEMGEVRFKEMQCVQKVLGLTGMTVLDLPDSGLKEMDPREIENVIFEHLEKLEPQIVVTYAVHGISGFHDHLVTHAVVKNLFVRLKGEREYLKRLALFTIDEATSKKITWVKANSSTKEEIDCILTVDEADLNKALAALDCYVTYKETIIESSIKEVLTRDVCFEIFGESFDPPLTDLCENLVT